MATEINKIPSMTRKAILVCCIVFGLAMSHVFTEDVSYLVSSVFFGMGFSILLAANERLYSRRVGIIKRVGDISYSVYLSHIPIILLCDHIFAESILHNCTLLYFVFVMLLIGGISWLSHKCLESI